MDVKQIDKLEALLSKATPGEWAQYGPDVTDAEGVPLFGLLGAKEADDTALVVAMKAALPALLQLAREVTSGDYVLLPVGLDSRIEDAYDEVAEAAGCEPLLAIAYDAMIAEAQRLYGQTVALVPVTVKEGA